MNHEEMRVTVAEAAREVAPKRGEEDGATQPLSPSEANEAVIRVVSSWKGVSVQEHRFGGVEFRVGRRELGHLHTTFADLPFPRQVRDELVEAGRAIPHHVLPDSGWVTIPMRTTTEVTDVIALQRNYRRATNAQD